MYEWVKRIGGLVSNMVSDYPATVMEAWFVLYLRPRCEKKVAKLCAQQEISHYLPLVRRSRRYQRRTVQVDLPVFPGYIFARITPETRDYLVRSSYVLRFIPSRRPFRLLRQLVNLRRALRADPSLGTTTQSLARKGRMVRVIDGPFQGVEGVVDRVRARTRVFINVELMQRAVVVEVSAGQLQVVD